MAKEIIETNEDVEVSVVEKESLWSKTKRKASEIGDLRLKDVGKGVLKVGAVIGGGVLIAKIIMKSRNNDDSEIFFDLSDIDDVVDSTAEEVTE